MQRTIFAFLMLLFSTQGFASTSDLVNQFIENPQQVGKTSRMTYLFWDVYDASLYAPKERTLKTSLLYWHYIIYARLTAKR